MKFRTLLISSLALGMFTAIPAIHAQDEKAPAAPEQKSDAPKAERKGPRGMPTPEERIAHIDKAVGGLTDDQKAKIKDIYEKAAEQFKALAPEERREKGREIMQSTREQVRAVLTADQQAKFDAMPQERGPQRKKKSED
jgi:Spy/CpxP family protein refolding chaperone